MRKSVGWSELDQQVLVSVCIATYNGGRYVADQLTSILEDLPHDSEIVVLDDRSTDDTLRVLSQMEDSRIRLACHLFNSGHVSTFADLLRMTSGEYIFLADQDDLWPPGRTQAMINGLQHYELVAGNFSEFGARTGFPHSVLSHSDSGRSFKNILGLVLGRRPYFGCAMGFRKDLLCHILPIPQYVEAHDHWIALCGNISGSVLHIDEPVVCRRIHESNLSPSTHRSFAPMYRTRVILLRSIIELLRRSLRAKYRAVTGMDRSCKL